MWVRTTVSLGAPQKPRRIGLWRMTKGATKAFLYVCLLIGIGVLAYQLIYGGIIDGYPSPSPWQNDPWNLEPK